MHVTQHSSSDQSALWNGAAGRGWVEAQDLLDRVFEPFQVLLVEAVRTGSGRRVLDVGCGTGSTTLAVARLPGVNCTGIDVSDPMIAAARARAERDTAPGTFLLGDAQVYAFQPASFDTIISRFGVMFFGDPVGAFQNLRRAASDGAQLRFVAWRSAADNPFMTTAERAAAPLLPELPGRQPNGPGQFAFADPLRVASILEKSGWGEVDIRSIDATCTLPERDLACYFTRLGPVGVMLQDADEETRARVVQTVRNAFDAYVHGAEVRFTAACWTVSASAW